MSMSLMPIPKHGSCPPGYSSHGNMCVPLSSAKACHSKERLLVPVWLELAWELLCGANGESQDGDPQARLVPAWLQLAWKLLRLGEVGLAPLGAPGSQDPAPRPTLQ